MIAEVKNSSKEIESICKKHFVKTLHLFGSAAKGEFTSGKSDLDFVVEFTQDIDPINYADNFFSLQESLKQLFNNEIDLLSYRALKNPIIISEVNNSKIELYAA